LFINIKFHNENLPEVPNIEIELIFDERYNYLISLRENLIIDLIESKKFEYLPSKRKNLKFGKKYFYKSVHDNDNIYGEFTSIKIN
jgi:hypothetical protein